MTNTTDHIPNLKALLQERDGDKILAFLSEHPQVLDQKDSANNSGLMLLAYYQLIDVLKKAIPLKSSFNLYEAATCGLLDEVQANLAGKEQEIDSYAPDGFTALTLAAFFSRQKVVEYLLEKGANPNIAANNTAKVAPIHSAVAANHLGICQLLVKYGANVNLAQAQGVTPLHSAAHLGNLAIVQLLVEAGANIDAKMDSGETALDFAEKDGHEEVKKYLLGVK